MTSKIRCLKILKSQSQSYLFLTSEVPVVDWCKHSLVYGLHNFHSILVLPPRSLILLATAENRPPLRLTASTGALLYRGSKCSSGVPFRIDHKHRRWPSFLSSAPSPLSPRFTPSASAMTHRKSQEGDFFRLRVHQKKFEGAASRDTGEEERASNDGLKSIVSNIPPEP
jgi:hypothetical protein